MRVALGVEYNGTAYNGWQRQKTGVGVQTLLEKALATVANEPINTVCAGRTDTGVHAIGQVVHFDTSADRPDHGWLLGVNSSLPDDINLRWASAVSDDFHARFSATERTYRYLILNRPVRSSLNRNRAWVVHRSLNDEKMRGAAECLLGKHDFSAFRAAGCQATTPVREITNVTLVRDTDWIAIMISANAFLQHMVRNITGALVAIGQGEQPPEWIESVLASRDRTSAGIAAPPQGLTLVRVRYPEEFALPDLPLTARLGDY